MNLNNPNAYPAGSDSERIELALDYALKNSLPLEITARQSDDGRSYPRPKDIRSHVPSRV